MRPTPTLLLAAALVSPSAASAWGGRSHDIVTRVAVRLVGQRTNGDPAILAPLLMRQGMLAHFSNVPDIVWRSDSVPNEVNRLNSPTHWIALDRLDPRPTLAHMPLTWKEARDRARGSGHDLATGVGTAPWRVGQLARLTREAMQRIPSGGSREQLEKPVNDMLLYAGLLSHFVADQTNPDHSSKDFDGWHCGQGGIHEYFESSLVDALPLSLAQAVFDHARKNRPFERLLGALSPAERSRVTADPVQLTFLVTLDAYGRRDRMLQLDAEHAVLAPSRKAPVRMRATRRAASLVAAEERPFIVERLALAADVLARLWLDAWKAAGRPNMKTYKSYAYPVAPAFVYPDYIE
jgi:hypothetical protein